MSFSTEKVSENVVKILNKIIIEYFVSFPERVSLVRLVLESGLDNLSPEQLCAFNEQVVPAIRINNCNCRKCPKDVKDESIEIVHTFIRSGFCIDCYSDDWMQDLIESFR